MKIDFNTTINNLDGNPLKIKSNDQEKNMTIGYILSSAAIVQLPTDDKMDVEEKIALFSIAKKVVDNEELTTEEMVLVKKRIGEMHGPLVVGRAYEILG